ncbi:hypothetical protein HSBAA_18020 [Vreelandella sulfidaeris]|uniref:Uncharacterized protein n=1 Tax=Vreelandella sulfidaeris TaxID=115553 RepID=A0A455U3A7_9GAMM|nr:hypothetical protein HSBAA_18020 [Halomonas sulfidaeris]
MRCTACRFSRQSPHRAGCSGAPGETSTNLKLEARFDDALVTDLATAGHDVEVLPDAFSDTMGHAGGIVHHPDGLIESAHDPRSNGGAASVSTHSGIRIC